MPLSPYLPPTKYERAETADAAAEPQSERPYQESLLQLYTVDVPLDNVVLLDLLFQPAIVGVQRFFLLLELCIFRLQRGDVGELAADQRGLDRFCGGFKQYDTALMGGAVCRLILCSAVCVIHGLCLLIGCNILD